KNSVEGNPSDARLRPPEPDPPQIGASKGERYLLTRCWSHRRRPTAPGPGRAVLVPTGRVPQSRIGVLKTRRDVERRRTRARAAGCRDANGAGGCRRRYRCLNGGGRVHGERRTDARSEERRVGELGCRRGGG